MPSTTWWRSSRRPDLTSDERLDALAERLGHHFADRTLLAMAMAHRSWCAETPNESSNERLEFLGDAVLGLVVNDHLFRHYELPEGELAKVRASVVNSAALAEVAAELDIGAAVLLGKGEDASGGREKPSILADAMEAVIGAVYLDGGWEPAAELVMKLVGARIATAAEGPGGHDYKTRLQELAARNYDTLPRYDVLDEGPDHAKKFFATVRLEGVAQGHGEGRSKKQAEQAAARAAWRALVAGRPVGRGDQGEAAAGDPPMEEPPLSDVLVDPPVGGTEADA